MSGTDTPLGDARGRRIEATSSLRLIGAAAARVHGAAIAAEGRSRTRQALRGLAADGWRVVHGYRLPGGQRVDHLLVGPSGVYLLESRAWCGVVTVDLKGATITPEGSPSAAWTARGQHRSLPAVAGAVSRALSASEVGPCPAPRAVVVVWAPFPEGVAASGCITYVAGDRLAGWLSDQPSAAAGEVPPRTHRSAVLAGSAER